MKISSLVKPSAAALAITLCGTPYVAAQESGDNQNAASQQTDTANQSQANQSQANQSQANQSQANQSQANQSQANQSQANQSQNNRDQNNRSQDASSNNDANHATCPICGLKVEDATGDSKGVKVVDVESGSPADKAGVKKGDTLVSINDKDVKSSQQMHEMMSKQQKKSEQSTVKVGVQRDGADRQLTLTLKSQDEQKSNDDKTRNDNQSSNMRDGNQNRNNLDANNQGDTNKQASLGVTLDPAPSQFGKGVRISSVYTNGPAQKAGLKTGDRILKVDGKEVSSVQELQDSIDKMDPDHSAKISVMADGQEKELDVKLASKAETIQRAMVGNNQFATQPANQLNADQSLSQTLNEIRNELRELRNRVDAMDQNGDRQNGATNDRNSNNNDQNQ